MGYSHYWYQKRAFTPDEWTMITAEAKRIIAKAQRALYCGKEDFASATNSEKTDMGFRVGFKEEYAWRTFAHEECKPAMQGEAIKLADGTGTPGTTPEIDNEMICLNGVSPDEYETFALLRVPHGPSCPEGVFNCVKTEYRAYDPVVVSILHVARTVAPDAIRVKSDGGDEAIKLMF